MKNIVTILLLCVSTSHALIYRLTYDTTVYQKTLNHSILIDVETEDEAIILKDAIIAAERHAPFNVRLLSSRYIKGSVGEDGSIRMATDEDTGYAEVQQRVSGIWQPASLELGADTLWLGHSVGVAGVGHHLSTESTDGHLHFHVHSEFEDGLTVKDAQVVHAIMFMEDFDLQSDYSEEWTGTVLEFSQTPQSFDTLLKTMHYKTGATAATEYVHIQIWEEAFDTGPLMFDQKYPASTFAANSDIDLTLQGWLEFDVGVENFWRISSDADFSLKMDTTLAYPYFSADFSVVHQDDLLQTDPWYSGITCTEGQYMIVDRKVYVCNVTGAQTGTWESNSDKWEVLTGFRTTHEVDPIFTSTHSYYVADLLGMTVNRIPFGNSLGNGLQDSADLTYSGGAVRIADGGIYLDRTGADSFIVFSRDGTQIGQIRGGDGMIAITDEGGGPDRFKFYPATGVAEIPLLNTPEIYNSAGDLQIQSNPNQGDVDIFGGTDVANNENGGILYIRRQAPEFNRYLRFYISQNGTAYMHASGVLTLQAQQPFIINSVTDYITFKLGDNAGDKKVYFKDSDGNTIAYIDSNGNLNCAEIETSNGINVGANVIADKFYLNDSGTDYLGWTSGDGVFEFAGGLMVGGTLFANDLNGDNITIATADITNYVETPIVRNSDGDTVTIQDNLDVTLDVDITNSLYVGNDIIVTDDVFVYGDVSARNHEVRGAMFFDDGATQEEAGERHFSQGHTHTAIYSGNWYDASAENISERDIHFSPDGLMMYIIGLADDGTGDCSIWEYALTIPWDLSTVGSPVIESIETYGGNQVGLFISRNGRRFWTVCTANDTVIEYSMNPWNISTLSWVQAKDISLQDSSPSAIFWSSSGDRLFVAGDSDNDIVAFSVVSEFDIGGMSWFQDFGTDIDAPTGLQFSSDGRRMYVMDGSAEDDIHEFHIYSPWMIETARLVNLYDVSSQNTSPQGIFLTADNSKIFMVGTSTPDGVYGYDLGSEVGGAIISNNGPIRPGSMTTTQRDALDAVNGDIIYNTTTNVFNFYENDSWVTK